MNFKVGDWVRIFGRPTRILRVEGDTEKPEYYDTSYGYRDGCLESKGLELWQPKTNEWCWFWNYKTDIPNFMMFVNVTNDNEGNDLYIASACEGGCEIYFDYCEPFIGSLPSFLQH